VFFAIAQCFGSLGSHLYGHLVYLGRHQIIPIILIGNIDFAVRRGHALTVAPHLSTKRRHVDLLLVASAICPATLLSRLPRSDRIHRPG
jgi:hypothetical protein